MSQKNMGSSIDDFLKEEGTFEEAQTQAVKEIVAWQLAEEEENLEEQDGHVAQDEPFTGGPPARPEERHYTRQPATGGGDGGTPREH